MHCRFKPRIKYHPKHDEMVADDPLLVIKRHETMHLASVMVSARPRVHSFVWVGAMTASGAVERARSWEGSVRCTRGQEGVSKVRQESDV